MLTFELDYGIVGLELSRSREFLPNDRFESKDMNHLCVLQLLIQVTVKKGAHFTGQQYIYWKQPHIHDMKNKKAQQ